MQKSTIVTAIAALLALVVQVGSACTYIKSAYSQTNGSYADIRAYIGCNNWLSEGYSVSMDYQYTYQGKVYRDSRAIACGSASQNWDGSEKTWYQYITSIPSAADCVRVTVYVRDHGTHLTQDTVSW